MIHFPYRTPSPMPDPPAAPWTRLRKLVALTRASTVVFAVAFVGALTAYDSKGWQHECAAPLGIVSGVALAAAMLWCFNAAIEWVDQ